MRPFRFGVGVWHVGSRAELADKARKVEALRYDTLSFPDHLTDRIAPMPAVMTAAEATTRLRIGTNVLNNDLRHPVLVAREAAAVDLLSDGRLQLGLGAGSIKSEYDEAGFSFDPGSVRVEQLAEAVRIIRKLLEGDEVTFSGRHYRVAGHSIAPHPIQGARKVLHILKANVAEMRHLVPQSRDLGQRFLPSFFDSFGRRFIGETRKHLIH